MLSGGVAGVGGEALGEGLAYRHEPRELVIEYRLPPGEVVPRTRHSRYCTKPRFAALPTTRKPCDNGAPTRRHSRL